MKRILIVMIIIGSMLLTGCQQDATIRACKDVSYDNNFENESIYMNDEGYCVISTINYTKTKRFICSNSFSKVMIELNYNSFTKGNDFDRDCIEVKNVQNNGDKTKGE